MTSRVVWCDRAWIPHHYGFCPDEKAWKHEMKRLEVKDVPYPALTTDACCTHFEKSKNKSGDSAGNSCSIVSISHEKRDPLAIVTLLVHEAMHVWRQMLSEMGEEEPSSEFEAYAMQNIVFRLLAAYEATRGSILRASEKPL